MFDRYLMGFLFAKSKFRTQPCRHVVFVVLCLFLMVELCSSNCRNDNCEHGFCRADGVCECEQGWTGSQCNHCGGRARLDAPTGTIYDTVGPYNTDTTCVWLIDSGSPGTSISLHLETFATECSWDYLYILDGDSIYAPLVAAFSGPLRYRDTGISLFHEVTTTSGYAFLYFYSDAAFKLDGFNITYRVDSCSSGCSNHGVCDPTYKNCSCYPLWAGDSCDVLACPANCSGNGVCSASQKMCVCNPGYEGSDCSVRSSQGHWLIEEGKAYGRASAALFQQDNLVWIIGGYSFDNTKNISIVSYNLDDSSSEEISQTGNIPEARYGHSAVLYQDEIFVFGGSLNGRKVSGELLIFNLTSNMWTSNTSGSNVSVSNVTFQGHPIAVEGHTALLYKHTMVVMFGYSPKYRYMSKVQEYNFVNKTWSIAETSGVQVIGTYGHSSAYDPIRDIVYVYAGFVATKQETGLTDHLYQYNLAKKEWRVLPSSNHPRFLHSAVILNDVMFVFGGNTHTDSVKHTGAKCFSSDFMAYRIDCQSWSIMPPNTGLSQDIARYGHSAFTYDGKMFIYSGFTGVMQENIITYSPGNCSASSNAAQCLDASMRLPCHWDIDSQHCINDGNTSLLHCPPQPTRGSSCYSKYLCSKCQLTPGCGWCDGSCQKQSECDDQNDIFCNGIQCNLFTSCRACHSYQGCKWRKMACENQLEVDSTIGSCDIPCDAFTSCQKCLGMDGCMWCSNQQRCIDSDSYLTSFQYGLCWEWHTNYRQCPVHNCSEHLTCEACHADVHCGWCDSGEMNGLGRCIEGSLTGPFSVDETGDAVLNHALCPADSWYFFDCPSCQCNGHSRCVNETSSVCVNCQNNTEGRECESCASGYHGNALNGGICSLCKCNDHGTQCDRALGTCYCSTKGVIGDHCERCDIEQNYYGNPLKGTCYYRLTMNYEYTFNLSSNDELYVTMINLMTSPEANNRNIEFILHMSKEVNMNITVKSNKTPGIELPVAYEANTYYYTVSLSSSTYNFDESANTTFFVYLSNFTIPLSFKATSKTEDQVPSLPFYILLFFIVTLVILLTFLGVFWQFYQICTNRFALQVSVRQQFMLLNLLEFLVVFFSCFLSFLLFFVIGWKVKQRCDSYHRQQITFYQRAYDLVIVLVVFFVCFSVIILLFGIFLKLKDYWGRHRRRRNRAVELALMARRPFTSMSLVIENSVPPDIVVPTNKKHPLALATETCFDNKAQVATIFMQIPMPDGNKVPYGQTRLCLASALVQAKSRKGERRHSQQIKQEPRDTVVRSGVSLNNTCTATSPPVAPMANQETTEADRNELAENRLRPELHIIQNQLPASYDNAAMV